MKEPSVDIGILQERTLSFSLLSPYSINGECVEGRETLCCEEGKIRWRGALHEELLFQPIDLENSLFELENVTIGVAFHWERKEVQRFQGALLVVVEGEELIAINRLGVETYLTSVISSEMRATSSLELLKAHAVISRSWLLANLRSNLPHPTATACNGTEQLPSAEELATGDASYIRWYDREAHTRFDVCADDHCQRYQGATRASSPAVQEAIAATRGEVLTYQGSICDARYAKCCGGALEEFATCWGEESHPYLVAKCDNDNGDSLPDLTNEEEAEKWIRSTPEAFCHTHDRAVLSQVLNHYDQETADFYRWRVTYTQAELSALITQKLGVDLGAIRSLIPLERGKSGRISLLRIEGSRGTISVGKELEIRRILSPSHLYSSAFVVEREELSDSDTPQRFTLLGAGWGHGVGLCQIGAAMMGEAGYSYQAILQHYYHDASLERRYQ